MNIGIVILATNAYFPLGIRLIKKFTHYYTGNAHIKFYFFSDTSPAPYINPDIDVEHIEQSHTSWVQGTNSKFHNIISLESSSVDYLYYFDADTNIDKHFDEKWMLGKLVGGQHFGDESWMKHKKPFDRYPKSKAYIPETTELPQMYYLGAFFGGQKDNVINFCKVLKMWQDEDKKIPYEPGVNDESYINKYFHIYKPTTVLFKDFAFKISDKGGIGETRNTNLDISKIKEDLLGLRSSNNVDIRENKVITI